MDTYLGSKSLTFVKKLQWPLEMWYMGAYPGVGACPGHYSTCVQDSDTIRQHTLYRTMLLENRLWDASCLSYDLPSDNYLRVKWGLYLGSINLLYGFFECLLLACYKQSSIGDSKDVKQSELLPRREMAATSLWLSVTLWSTKYNCTLTVALLGGHRFFGGNRRQIRFSIFGTFTVATWL